MDCSMPGFTVPHYLLEFAQSHASSCDAIQPSHSLSAPSTSALSLSQHQGLFPVSQLFASGDQSRSLSFSFSPSNEHSGLLSFRIDWFVLAFQVTLKSLLQNNLKASTLWCLASFMFPLSHPYMTTGKTIALTIMDLCQQSDVSGFYYTV